MEKEETKSNNIKICLTMIVKNEENIVLRALKSVIHSVHCYVIHDTGSSDRTVSNISAFMEEAGVKGILKHSHWVNFAHNRNLLIRDAESFFPDCDYMLILDADDFIEPESNCPNLNGNLFRHIEDNYTHVFNLLVKTGLDLSTSFWRPHLIKLHSGWEWKSPVHEYLDRPKHFGVTISKNIPGLRYISTCSGNRSQVGAREKYMSDAKIIIDEINRVRTNFDHNDPNYFSRLSFYLAQSFKDAGATDLAIRQYSARSLMYYGYAQEQYMSHLNISLLTPVEYYNNSIKLNLLTAVSIDPSRPEAPFYLAKFCADHEKNLIEALAWAKYAANTPCQKEHLFSDTKIPGYAINLVQHLEFLIKGQLN